MICLVWFAQGFKVWNYIISKYRILLRKISTACNMEQFISLNRFWIAYESISTHNIKDITKIGMYLWVFDHILMLAWILNFLLCSNQEVVPTFDQNIRKNHVIYHSVHACSYNCNGRFIFVITLCGQTQYVSRSFNSPRQFLVIMEGRMMLIF